MASCLSELQWLAKEKLGLKKESKILICLEKDGTEVHEEEIFQKMGYATQFIAKEVPLYFLLLNDNYKSISRPMNEKCTNVQIKPRVKKKSFGLKITGG